MLSRSPQFPGRSAKIRRAQRSGSRGQRFDSVNSHKKFCTKEGLNFKLLADTEHREPQTPMDLF